LVKRKRPRRRRTSLLCRLLAALVSVAIGSVGLSFLLVLPWRWLPLPTTSFMLQTYFAYQPRQSYFYKWVPYRNISPYIALAVIAAEDQRFPEHHGFDFEELEQVLEDYQQGKELRGASTISQQVAKNLYLWPGRSLWRKVPEAWFTVLIEWLWPKQRILEVYLNIAQFDNRTFGVEAASRQLFSVSAANLTIAEATSLAAVLPAPELYEVNPPSLEVVQRQVWILQQMEQLGGVEYLRSIEPRENRDRDRNWDQGSFDFGSFLKLFPLRLKNPPEDATLK